MAVSQPVRRAKKVWRRMRSIFAILAVVLTLMMMAGCGGGGGGSLTSTAGQYRAICTGPATSENDVARDGDYLRTTFNGQAYEMFVGPTGDWEEADRIFRLYLHERPPSPPPGPGQEELVPCTMDGASNEFALPKNQETYSCAVGTKVFPTISKSVNVGTCKVTEPSGLQISHEISIQNGEVTRLSFMANHVGRWVITCPFGDKTLEAVIEVK